MSGHLPFATPRAGQSARIIQVRTERHLIGKVVKVLSDPQPMMLIGMDGVFRRAMASRIDAPPPDWSWERDTAQGSWIRTAYLVPVVVEEVQGVPA